MAIVTVVGAGLFGMTAALELRRRGHEVRVDDPAPRPDPRAASTDLSKIVRLDYGADEVWTALMERALAGWRAWNAARAARGRGPVFHEDGLLLLARAPLAAGGFEHDSLAMLRRRGHAAERLDRAAIAARFPAWAEAGCWTDGYLDPQGGWAAATETMEWLREEAIDAGVRFASPAPREDAAVVVVAAGVWTPGLLPETAPLLTITGQPVLLLRPERPERFRPPGFPPFTADVSRTGLYGFPATAEGVVKVAVHGAGLPMGADDPRDLPPSEETAIRALLRDTLPALAGAPRAGGRLCLYDDTPDGHFLVGRVPGRARLVVAAGGSGHAFKFAPVLGELVADVVEERVSPAWLAAARARCAWREPSRQGAGDAARSARSPRAGEAR